MQLIFIDVVDVIWKLNRNSQIKFLQNCNFLITWRDVASKKLRFKELTLYKILIVKMTKIIACKRYNQNANGKKNQFFSVAIFIKHLIKIGFLSWWMLFWSFMVLEIWFRIEEIRLDKVFIKTHSFYQILKCIPHKQTFLRFPLLSSIHIQVNENISQDAYTWCLH